MKVREICLQVPFLIEGVQKLPFVPSPPALIRQPIQVDSEEYLISEEEEEAEEPTTDADAEKAAAEKADKKMTMETDLKQTEELAARTKKQEEADGEMELEQQMAQDRQQTTTTEVSDITNADAADTSVMVGFFW